MTLTIDQAVAYVAKREAVDLVYGQVRQTTLEAALNEGLLSTRYDEKKGRILVKVTPEGHRRLWEIANAD
jgi:hypothetical protein